MNNPNSPDAQPTEDKDMPVQPLPSVQPQTKPLTQPSKTPQSHIQSRTKVPVWRFLIAILIQSTLIVAVPFKSAMTYAKGQTVTLQTLPVDPYDLLRGYSQTLRFEISDIERLKQLPGAENVFLETDNRRYEPTQLYVTLAEPTGPRIDGKAPTAWEPVALSTTYPENLKDNQIALQGYAQGWQVIYGLETYYMPEDQRNDINEQIRTEQQAEDSAFVVDVKIDEGGNSVPLSLWIRDQEFQF
ncbi:MAG: GDYXXLXY domain-containing protein [Cyanobacteria bacterium J06621_11]